MVDRFSSWVRLLYHNIFFLWVSENITYRLCHVYIFNILILSICIFILDLICLYSHQISSYLLNDLDFEFNYYGFNTLSFSFINYLIKFFVYGTLFLRGMLLHYCQCHTHIIFQLWLLPSQSQVMQLTSQLLAVTSQHTLSCYHPFGCLARVGCKGSLALIQIFLFQS